MVLCKVKLCITDFKHIKLIHIGLDVSKTIICLKENIGYSGKIHSIILQGKTGMFYHTKQL